MNTSLPQPSISQSCRTALELSAVLCGISKEGKHRGNNDNFVPHRHGGPILVYYFQVPAGIVHAGSLLSHAMT